MQNDQRFDDFTEDQLRRIEAQWKSDIEMKVDALVSFAEEYRAFLKVLIERERNRQAFQRAVIEHTLKSLILAGFVAVGALIWTGMKTELQDFIRLFGNK